MSLDRNSGGPFVQTPGTQVGNGRKTVGDQGLQEIVRCHREGEQEGNAGSSIERGSGSAIICC